MLYYRTAPFHKFTSFLLSEAFIALARGVSYSFLYLHIRTAAMDCVRRSFKKGFCVVIGFLCTPCFALEGKIRLGWESWFALSCVACWLMGMNGKRYTGLVDSWPVFGAEHSEDTSTFGFLQWSAKHIQLILFSLEPRWSTTSAKILTLFCSAGTFSGWLWF